MLEYFEGSPPPPNPLNHELIVQLHTFLNFLKEGQTGQELSVVNPPIGQKLQQFFRAYNVNVDQFFSHANINKSSWSSLKNGNFTNETLTAVLATIEQDAHEWAVRAGQNDRWVPTDKGDIQDHIGAVAKSLEHLVKVVRESNELGEEGSAIGPIEKAQLIAILEATLAELKAPAIEQSRLRSVFNWIGGMFRRAAEKGISDKLKDAADDAVNAGEGLMEKVQAAPGVDSLSDLSNLPLS